MEDFDRSWSVKHSNWRGDESFVRIDKIHDRQDNDNIRKLPVEGASVDEQRSRVERTPFAYTAQDILESIIEGDNEVIDQILDPDFRFTTRFDPKLGASLSDAFAILLARSRAVRGQKGAAVTNEMSRDKADKYAMKMFDEVEKLKAEKGKALSVRETAKLLTERNIKTAAEKTVWHPTTVTALQKRWKELGLLSK